VDPALFIELGDPFGVRTAMFMPPFAFKDQENDRDVFYPHF
jgi:hypothetical protein